MSHAHNGFVYALHLRRFVGAAHKVAGQLAEDSFIKVYIAKLHASVCIIQVQAYSKNYYFLARLAHKRLYPLFEFVKALDTAGLNTAAVNDIVISVQVCLFK